MQKLILGLVAMLFAFAAFCAPDYYKCPNNKKVLILSPFSFQSPEKQAYLKATKSFFQRNGYTVDIYEDSAADLNAFEKVKDTSYGIVYIIGHFGYRGSIATGSETHKNWSATDEGLDASKYSCGGVEVSLAEYQYYKAIMPGWWDDVDMESRLFIWAGCNSLISSGVMENMLRSKEFGSVVGFDFYVLRQWSALLVGEFFMEKGDLLSSTGWSVDDAMDLGITHYLNHPGLQAQEAADFEKNGYQTHKTFDQSLRHLGGEDFYANPDVCAREVVEPAGGNYGICPDYANLDWQDVGKADTYSVYYRESPSYPWNRIATGLTESELHHDEAINMGSQSQLAVTSVSSYGESDKVVLESYNVHICAGFDDDPGSI